MHIVKPIAKLLKQNVGQIQKLIPTDLPVNSSLSMVASIISHKISNTIDKIIMTRIAEAYELEDVSWLRDIPEYNLIKSIVELAVRDIMEGVEVDTAHGFLDDFLGTANKEKILKEVKSWKDFFTLGE